MRNLLISSQIGLCGDEEVFDEQKARFHNSKECLQKHYLTLQCVFHQFLSELVLVTVISPGIISTGLAMVTDNKYSLAMISNKYRLAMISNNKYRLAMVSWNHRNVKCTTRRLLLLYC